MTTNVQQTSPDPYAIPPTGARPDAGSRPPRSYARHPQPVAGPDARTPGAPGHDAHPDPRALLLRLVPHAQVLSALGVADEDFLGWAAAGRAWATYTLPDGRRLADPAEVLAVLGVRNGGLS